MNAFEMNGGILAFGEIEGTLEDFLDSLEEEIGRGITDADVMKKILDTLLAPKASEKRQPRSREEAYANSNIPKDMKFMTNFKPNGDGFNSLYYLSLFATLGMSAGDYFFVDKAFDHFGLPLPSYKAIFVKEKFVPQYYAVIQAYMDVKSKKLNEGLNR